MRLVPELVCNTSSLVLVLVFSLVFYKRQEEGTRGEGEEEEREKSAGLALPCTAGPFHPFPPLHLCFSHPSHIQRFHILLLYPSSAVVILDQIKHFPRDILCFPFLIAGKIDLKCSSVERKKQSSQGGNVKATAICGGRTTWLGDKNCPLCAYVFKSLRQHNIICSRGAFRGPSIHPTQSQKLIAVEYLSLLPVYNRL